VKNINCFHRIYILDKILYFDPLLFSTWKRLSSGLPTYTPLQVAKTQTITIRDGLNRATVLLDGVVGGNT
jgi:hypothetical protein